MINYIVEFMWDKEQEWTEKILETTNLEEALAFARKKQKDINWSVAGSPEYRQYITLDKYIDGKLVETIDFREENDGTIS